MPDALTPAALADLRAKAEAATPGEWHWIIHDHSMASLGVGDNIGIGSPLVLGVSPCPACQEHADPKEWKWGRCSTPNEANADFIAAANPQTVLALIAALDAVTRERDEAKLMSDADRRYAATVRVASAPAPEPGKAEPVVADASQIVREEWQRLVVDYKLRPGSTAEILTARILQHLYLAPPPAAPEGWALVPKEATMQMLEAAKHSWAHDQGPKATSLYGSEAADIYRALLAAVPVPPSAGDERRGVVPRLHEIYDGNGRLKYAEGERNEHRKPEPPADRKEEDRG